MKDRKLGCLVLGGMLLLSQPSHAAGPPPRSSADAPPQVRSSTIVLPVSVSLSSVAALLNRKVPNPVYTINENRDACIPAKMVKVCVLPRPWPWHGCAQWLETKVSPAVDCHLDGAIRRGEFVVGGSQRDVSISVPLDINVTARGRGDIDRMVQTTAKGSAEARASVSVDVTPDWRPVADINPDYSWKDPIGVWLLGFRVTFASRLDRSINEQIQKAKQSLPEQLAALDLKARAERIWRDGFQVYQLSQKPAVWVRLTPEAVGYSGYRVENGVLSLNLMMKAKTETFIGAKPAPSLPTALPALQRDISAPAFVLYAPVYADYAAIEQAVEAYLQKGKAQSYSMGAAGAAMVTFGRVQVYPTTGGALAIGVALEGRLPNRLLSSGGTVWLTVTPSVDNSQHTIRMSRFQVAGETRSFLLNSAVQLLNIPGVNAHLKEALKYDYGPQLALQRAQLNASLGQGAGPRGLRFSGQLDQVSLNRITPTSSGLLVDLDARGVASLSVDASAIDVASASAAPSPG